MSNNIPTMSVDDAVEKLSSTYISIIKAKLPVKTMPSVMLWGPPGVGKSQGVKQIGMKIEKEVKKKVVITDVRLLLFNPIDLRGIPTANEDKTLAIWLKPQIFQMDPSNKVINILFLDEISAAPQSVQAAAYQITLDRTVGEHKLPENCIVIAAGNRTTDKSVAYKMPKALANRLMHIEIEGSFSSWKKWAKEAGINKIVIDFLSDNRQYFMCSDSSDDLAFPTPRSWEMVSNILNCVSDEPYIVSDLVEGLVGKEASNRLFSWYRKKRNTPLEDKKQPVKKNKPSHSYYDFNTVEKIFNGENVIIPEDNHLLEKMVDDMELYAKEIKDENINKIINSIKFAQLLPRSYSVSLLKKYIGIKDEDFRQKLVNSQEYKSWRNRVVRESEYTWDNIRKKMNIN